MRIIKCSNCLGKGFVIIDGLKYDCDVCKAKGVRYIRR